MTTNKLRLNSRIFLISFFLIWQYNYSQNLDSINIINRKFKFEIGIDLKGILQKDLGANLIFKVKNNSNRFVNLKSAKNYRFQLGFGGTKIIKEDVKSIDTLNSKYFSKEASTYSVQVNFGLEKVKFFGKFNFYYGIDFGSYYLYNNTGYTIYMNAPYYSTNYFITPPVESKKLGATISPFIGAKYRFTERISLSLESSYYFSYFFLKSKIPSVTYAANNNGASKIISLKTVQGFDQSANFLRFLTINYHL